MESSDTRNKKRKWVHVSGTFFPCPMPKNQENWVLGFYIITDIWQAMTADGWVTMVRLERWNIQDKAWWASKHESHNPPRLEMRDFDTKAPQETCQTCQKLSPRMFDDFFLCRYKECANFWKHNGAHVTTDLTYSTTFLQQRESRKEPPKPYGAYKGTSQFPEIATIFQTWWEDNYRSLQTEPITKENFEARMTSLNRGFWCPDCGMLNRRLKWQEWHCANRNCSFSKPGQPSIISASEIIEFGKKKQTNWEKLGFVRQEDLPDYTRYHYDLQNECRITVMIPKEGANAKHQGADWLWDRFQILANNGTLGLERRSTPSQVPGMVTSHYNANFGEDYKLVVDTSQSKSFEEAPEELSIARDSANTLCHPYKRTGGEDDFNECYVAAYFTDNTMHWHNDGERGLGNVIATWTLGGEGTMSFSPKLDQYWGQTKPGVIIEDDLLLTGSMKLAERKALKRKLVVDRQGHGTPDQLCSCDNCATALKTYREAFEALFEEKGEQRSDNAKARKWLTVPLTHGSLVVMHGENMQKHYVHEISVDTPLRFALTFRHISEEHHLEAETAGNSILEYPHIPDTTYLDDFRKEMSESEAKKKKK